MSKQEFIQQFVLKATTSSIEKFRRDWEFAVNASERQNFIDFIVSMANEVADKIDFDEDTTLVR